MRRRPLWLLVLLWVGILDLTSAFYVVISIFVASYQASFDGSHGTVEDMIAVGAFRQYFLGSFAGIFFGVLDWWIRRR